MLELKGYTIEKELGRGGMARVYLATHQALHRKVAIKVMSEQLDADKGFTERFMREARIAANLTHPHIVTIYDVNVYNDYHYIAMEYLPGGVTLEHKINEGISPDTGLKIIREIAAALRYAHSKGVVHRDVKPENIMFREDGTAVLCDFGVARMTTTDSNMTMMGTVIGTPQYMSPEQANGEEPRPTADIYSLGVLFYVVLTGKVPFEANSVAAVLVKQISEPIPRLEGKLAKYQPFLDHMVEKDKDRRYQNCDEVIENIDRLLVGGTIIDESLQQRVKDEISKAAAEQKQDKPRTQKVKSGVSKTAVTPSENESLQRKVKHEISKTAIEPKQDPSPQESEKDAVSTAAVALKQRASKRKYLLASAIIVVAIAAVSPFVVDQQDQPNNGEKSVAEPGTPVASTPDDSDKTTQTSMIKATDPAKPEVTEDPPQQRRHTISETTPGTEKVPDPAKPEISEDPPQQDQHTISGSTPLAEQEPDANTEQDDPSVPPTEAFILSKDEKRRVQQSLNALGFSAGAADGDFGPRTKAAIKAFKNSKGHSDDSELDKASYALLISEAARILAKANNIEPKMLHITGGRFTMGSPLSELGRASDEQQRKIYVKSFKLSKYEVTNREYRRYDPQHDKNDNHPVVQVSWDDAKAYADWLSKETKKNYRLPTEAEWEYAARANTREARYWGNDLEHKRACRYANVHDLASQGRDDSPDWEHHECNDRFEETAPVGRLKANRFGLHDMLGNVWEWTCSSYDPEYHGKEKACAKSRGDSSPRVARGGSYDDSPAFVRSAQRLKLPRREQLDFVGFRLAEGKLK